MYKKSKKLLAWSLVVCMILTNMLFTNAFAFERVSGADRYATAAEIALEAYSDGADTAILATGLVGADALAAAPLAAQLDAPILLTAKTALPDATVEALDDLGVTDVVVVGGKGAVAEDVVTELEDLGYEVDRIAGADRFETSLKIAEELDTADAAFLVNGIKTADALSVSPIAAALGMPIILTAANNVSDAAVDFLADMDVYVVGGKAVVSNDVLDTVDGERISGTDRYATNVAVIEEFAADLDLDTVYVASALDAKFADALAGGPLAAMTNSPMLLVGANLADATADYVEENLAEGVAFVALGGAKSVDGNVMEDLEAIVGGNDLSVKSVEATTEVIDLVVDASETAEDTVGNITADQELGFTVNNGKTMTVDELENEGYVVEFRTSKDVLDDGAATTTTDVNYTGKLDTDYEGTIGTKFSYEVAITMNGVEVASDAATVEFVDFETMAATIDKVEITIDTDKKITLNSNVITLDDAAPTFAVIEGTLDNDVYFSFKELSNYEGIVKYESSNPAVLDVDTDGSIDAIKEGTATVTITVGDTTEKVSLKVVDETREAKKATANYNPVKVTGTAAKEVELSIVDQFGDPYVVDVDDVILSGVITGSTQLADLAVVSATDAGKATISVTGKNRIGNGNAIIKWDSSEDGDAAYAVEDLVNLLTLPVYVNNETSVTKSVFEINLNDSESDDLTIDLSDADDDSVVIEYSEYSDGYYVGAATLATSGTSEDYTYAVYDKDGNDITSALAGDGKIVFATLSGDKKSLTITTDTTDKTGEVTVKLFSGDTKVLKDTLKIKVVDSKPVISKVNFTTGVKVDEVRTIKLSEVLKASYVGVNNANGPVKVDVTADTTASSEEIAVIYADKNNSGSFDSETELLGYVTYDATITNDGSDVTYTFSSGEITLSDSNKGDSGNIVINVIRRGETKVFDNVVIKVAIPD